MEVDMKQVDIRIFTKLIKILPSHPKPAMEVDIKQSWYKVAQHIA